MGLPSFTPEEEKLELGLNGKNLSVLTQSMGGGGWTPSPWREEEGLVLGDQHRQKKHLGLSRRYPEA